MALKHNTLTISTSAETSPFQAMEDRASEFVRRSKAANTIRAYKSDWALFEAWCKLHGQSFLPANPETVVLYVSDLSTTHKAGTVARYLSSIKQAHVDAGLESPTSG